jgi:hypothetical protein
MSQLNLTAKEDQLVLESVRARSAQYLSAYSVEDPDLVVLLDKIQTQLFPVVEQPANEPTAEQVETHFAAEDKAAEAAFLVDVPHEQVTHEDDATQDGHE